MILGINMKKRNPYPTEIEIMKTPVPHKRETLEFMKKWKVKHKEKGYHNDTALTDLIFGLAKVYNKQKNLSIIFSSKISSYTTNHITLKNKSIITALHELAHHLYGRNEKIACRWSIWLFIKIFPQEFEALIFKGHLLVKKDTITIK